MKKESIPELISEITDELNKLDLLVRDIGETADNRPAAANKRRIYEESLALKLHNFYTRCERIFQKIAADINGGTPVSFDWHKRLLHAMSLEIEKIRPPVISRDTAKALEEYLAFRHVVRNIYGFEIDSERLQRLIDKSAGTWRRVKKDVLAFVGFLRKLR